MANTLRIKRRAVGGGTGAPSSLANAELAFNEDSRVLYYGLGTGGTGGSATQVIAIGGDGAFATQAYVASAVGAIDLSAYITTATAAATYAPKASPAFTGTPTAPTASAGSNSTQIATTAFVSAAISALVNGAPSALDTLKELADALSSDASFSTTITNSLAGKLTAASNLSDLTSAATARTNLGLGSMALQASSNVSITGGSVDGITIDGGAF